MDGQSGFIETDGHVQEYVNQAEQNDGKCSDERPEGFLFFLCHI